MGSLLWGVISLSDNDPRSSHTIFVLKLIFLAVLALVGTRLSENDGVQIYRPPLPIWGPYMGDHIPFGPPRQLPVGNFVLKLISLQFWLMYGPDGPDCQKMMRFNLSDSPLPIWGSYHFRTFPASICQYTYVGH